MQKFAANSIHIFSYTLHSKKNKIKNKIMINNNRQVKHAATQHLFSKIEYFTSRNQNKRKEMLTRDLIGTQDRTIITWNSIAN